MSPTPEPAAGTGFDSLAGRLSDRLSGKAVLVTGASRGIGAAAARILAAAGARVALAARSVEACEREAGSIGANGGSAIAVGCDVGDYAQAAACVAATVDAFGGLDVIVNNAGAIAPIATLEQADPADWAAGVTTNLIGAFHIVRAAAGPLRNRDGGRPGVVINISSGAASRPLEGWSAYCAAKAGLAMLTRSIHLEMAESGIRVYGFRPGVVDTEMQVAIRASGINEVSRLPRDALANPEVPAAAIAWLAAEAPSDLAGQELDIRDPDLARRIDLGG